jgi:hypothetical protein
LKITNPHAIKASGDQVTDIFPIFPTPVIVGQFKYHDKWKNRFKNFDKIDRRPDTWTQPLNTSFPQIQDDDPYVTPDVRDEIQSDILIHVHDVMREYNMPEIAFFSEFWYNAYYSGQGQENHDHLSEINHNPFWSGIYFCRNCFPGSLTLSRREQFFRLQQYCDWDNTDPQLGQYYQTRIQPPISDGTIVMFPPHVLHQVVTDDRNEKNMRLTFSFNIYREKMEVTLSNKKTIEV